jgi:hypothetical protein
MNHKLRYVGLQPLFEYEARKGEYLQQELKEMQQIADKEKNDAYILKKKLGHQTNQGLTCYDVRVLINQNYYQHLKNKATNTCFVCGKSENLKICHVCKSIAYCSKKCQLEFWDTHKKTHEK